MSKHVKHVPKHRAAPTRSPLGEQPRKALRSTVVLSTVAVAATGVVVSGGVAGAGPASITAAAAGASEEPDRDVERNGVRADLSGDETGEVGMDLAPDADLAAAAAASVTGDRAASVSRSADRRAAEDPVKQAALAEPEQGEVSAVTDSVRLSDADPRNIAMALLGDFGFGSDQFGCLDSLYTRESGWSTTADNPTSSAYGIPQALPGEKMATAGADWATNPVTQIQWGLGYIQDVYGSPCGAWAHSESHGWY